MSIDIINPYYSLYYSNLKSTDVSSSTDIQNGDAITGDGSFSEVLKKTVTQEKTANLDAIFAKASETFGVPVALLKAVAKAESNFNPSAVSGAGAQGIMQLMPATARSLGVSDSFDPEQNIMGGAKYLSQMLVRFQGNTELALAAYNAGPGNVMKYDGVPPFKETQNYIGKVMAYSNEFSGTNTFVGTNSSYPANNFNLTGVNETSLSNAFQGLVHSAVAGDGTLDPKDAALFLSLYQYKFQLSALSISDSDEG
ncbi:lytic transglycosylase domain-containing protein [Sinanaerobacter chloroacetimidivorans]|jgi:hypothetical protein|uniref:Lytic transglycosylase domain-containing protein n=1 Tax=Sinanaerobacter chloroacetimidivorans TaxID=2818044 RepID=A0A8J7W1K9_9FIRM|nr:lytic transglycosylase domain-containing protein [Sinanaerobacter chloroacetimidivorans]MBR0599162.1 lytic transglycosylase domain-containing protein [Sinanaerobacter chloroacetimidivorans]